MEVCSGNSLGGAFLLRRVRMGRISVYFQYTKFEVLIRQPSGDVKLYSSRRQLSWGWKNNFESYPV